MSYSLSLRGSNKIYCCSQLLNMDFYFMLDCGSLTKQPNKHTTYKSLVGEEKKNVSLHLMHFARKKTAKRKMKSWYWL